MKQRTIFLLCLCLGLSVCMILSGIFWPAGESQASVETETQAPSELPVSPDTGPQASADTNPAASPDVTASPDAGVQALVDTIVQEELEAQDAVTSEPVDTQVMTARPSVNGRLHVEGPQLVDESGTPVQLRGVSTHGLTWYPGYVDEAIFAQLSDEWNCSLIRLAMYSDLYCNGQKEESLALMRKGIEAAIKADMYVIVDWHILSDYDPRTHQDEAAEFFELITSEYGQYPNLIYEICNEPNAGTNWGDVMEYSQKIIPLIREKVPESVILVGTPEYDNNLSGPVLRPLSFDNVMYVLHFYAASHKEGVMDELGIAIEAGLPVFISECGLSESSGDGTVDFGSAVLWFNLLNKYKISYAVWSISDKAETSAFLLPGFEEPRPINDDDLSATGAWVKQLIRGADPATIKTPGSRLVSEKPSPFVSWVINSLGERGFDAVKYWLLFAGASVLIIFLTILLKMVHQIYQLKKSKRPRTYDAFIADSDAASAAQDGSAGAAKKSDSAAKGLLLSRVFLFGSIILANIYLAWRIFFSVPTRAGWLAITCNIILLIVEIIGFFESLVLFIHMLRMKEHPLPVIPKELYPDVDVFIATYNEPEDLLRRTINGCVHLQYPDPSKVHIWICDDNRRASMRALAEEMGVGYFDRPDNQGAKAGNLNHALSLTSAPYVVTMDADMIPKSDFLLKTIPYFIDTELRNESLAPEKQAHLGFLQTPQCFYEPDIFQYFLYSEKRVPNEQDFFYRTIEPGKTSSNSVIYGGSNTVLSRKALEDIGGFYTGSITEDFATGLLIESKGYVSLALSEPLASGQTPQTFKEHIKQRTRWGRGVIVTGRKLKLIRRPGLTMAQRISYLSSVAYWYSPVKSLIYMLSPLIFAVFGLPVFACNWLELLVFWLPMFILSDLNLRYNSHGKISLKWSGIYETCVMPFMLIPVVKEFFGITLSTFKVTDKSRNLQSRRGGLREMMPFLIIAGLSVAGIIRIICIFDVGQVISMIILLFWIIRNLYYIIMSIFLIDGRDGEMEVVRVQDAEFVSARYTEDGKDHFLDGVTTMMTEHKLEVYWDDNACADLGARLHLTVENENHKAELEGMVTGVRESRGRMARIQTIEIMDFCDTQYEYWEILYDRVPSLPQTLHKDFGTLEHFWQNIAQRVSRTIK